MQMRVIGLHAFNVIYDVPCHSNLFMLLCALLPSWNRSPFRRDVMCTILRCTSRLAIRAFPDAALFSLQDSSLLTVQALLHFTAQSPYDHT
jgi:hypothetical protein